MIHSRDCQIEHGPLQECSAAANSLATELQFIQANHSLIAYFVYGMTWHDKLVTKIHQVYGDVWGLVGFEPPDLTCTQVHYCTVFLEGTIKLIFDWAILGLAVCGCLLM